MYRRTLRREVACTGIGLHSGRPVRLRLRPAPAEHGIRFARTDVGVEIPASLAHIGAQDHATNVLTFDYAREPVVSADLVLCAPVVEREARALRIPLQAHYAHLLVHGALHAQGWEHERVRDAKRMEAREAALLLALGFAAPYAR